MARKQKSKPFSPLFVTPEQVAKNKAKIEAQQRAVIQATQNGSKPAFVYIPLQLQR